MNQLTLIILLLGILSAVVIALLVFILILVARKKPKEDAGSLLMLHQQINQLHQIVDNKLAESTKAMQTQFGQSAQIIREVTEHLTKLDATNKQVVSVTDQLQNIQEMLKNPKQRGLVGEYFLETVLKNVLPPGSFQSQYAFSDGNIVDAVVFVDKKIIPIDAKFSLENYNRISEAKEPADKKRYESAFVADLKMRIEETAKYVRPEENTMDFAFMFIPHEAVYYDLLVNKVGAIVGDTDNLIYYAGKKRVIIVSPTSFLAYLQTVLQGLRNQKISEQARQIIRKVEMLGKHMGIYSKYMRKLGGNLGTAVSAYNKASHELAKVDKDVVRITGGETTIDAKPIEEVPLLEEN